MGIIFSRFRKEKSTYQKLEKLEDKIKSIETYTINTQRKQKRWVGAIRVFSVGFSIIAIIVYFLFYPPTWRDRLIRALPCVIPLFIMILSKNLVAWYFERKVARNSSKLSDLREEKKDLLEKVMEKETYKVAVEILNRFGEKSNFRTQPPSLTPTSTKQNQNVAKSTPNMPRIMPAQGYTPLGQPLTLQNRMIQSGRMTPISGSPGGGGGGMSQSMMNRPNFSNSGRMNTTGGGGPPSPPGFIQRYDNSRRGPSTPNSNNSQLASYNLNQKRTPFPIIDFENKGVFEKIIDRLIGDGPSDRFALICKECHKHNGMALEDEFYYSAFYCIFCNTLNPAKKLRPIAPSLPSIPLSSSSDIGFNVAKLNNSSSSSSTSDTGDDDDVIVNEPNNNDKANQQIKEQQRNIGFSDEILPPQEQGQNTDADAANETAEAAQNDEVHDDKDGDSFINNVDDDENLEVAAAIVDNVDVGDSKLDQNNDRIVDEEKKPVEKKND